MSPVSRAALAPLAVGMMHFLMPIDAEVKNFLVDMPGFEATPLHHIADETAAERQARALTMLSESITRTRDPVAWKPMTHTLRGAPCWLAQLGAVTFVGTVLPGKNQSLVVSLCLPEASAPDDPDGHATMALLNTLLAPALAGAPAWGVGTWVFALSPKQIPFEITMRIKMPEGGPDLSLKIYHGHLTERPSVESFASAVAHDAEVISASGGPAKVRLSDYRSWVERILGGVSHVIRLKVPDFLGGGQLAFWRGAYHAKGWAGTDVLLDADLDFEGMERIVVPQFLDPMLRQGTWLVGP